MAGLPNKGRPPLAIRVVLARATGNAYLLESMERVHDRLHTIRAFDFTVRERLIDSEAQHIAIGEAIRTGDRAQAAERMVTCASGLALRNAARSGLLTMFIAKSTPIFS